MKIHYWVTPGLLGRRDGRERTVHVWEVLAAVSEYYEMESSKLLKLGGGSQGQCGRRAGVKGREVQAVHLVFWMMDRYGESKACDLAKMFGYPHRSAASRGAAQVEERLARRHLDTMDAVSFVHGRLFGFGSADITMTRQEGR